MSYHRRAAADSLAIALKRLDDGVEDARSPLYWAFIAGERAAGRYYIEAKQDAAALGIMPHWLPAAAPADCPPQGYARRVALASMVSARDMFDARLHNAALYWAFVGGMLAAGRGYAAAKKEAASFGLMPAHERHRAQPATTTETA